MYRAREQTTPASLSLSLSLPPSHRCYHFVDNDRADHSAPFAPSAGRRCYLVLCRALFIHYGGAEIRSVVVHGITGGFAFLRTRTLAYLSSPSITGRLKFAIWRLPKIQGVICPRKCRLCNPGGQGAGGGATLCRAAGHKHVVFRGIIKIILCTDARPAGFRIQLAFFNERDIPSYDQMILRSRVENKYSAGGTVGIYLFKYIHVSRRSKWNAVEHNVRAGCVIKVE